MIVNFYVQEKGERHMKQDISVYLWQAASQGHQGHREVSQAAHDFVRRHIAQLTGREPSQLVFGRTKRGKPYVDNAGICFNISHSGGVVAAAFSECEIGVDIEALRPVNERIAARYFAASDRRYLAMTADPQERRRRFFEMWTAKEAYLKRFGVGLSGGLDFPVADENGRLSAVASDHLPSAEIYYRFVSEEEFFTDGQGGTAKDAVQYGLSVCADCIGKVFLSMTI